MLYFYNEYVFQGRVQNPVKMELFVKTIKGSQLLNIQTKTSILDALLVSECTSMIETFCW